MTLDWDNVVLYPPTILRWRVVFRLFWHICHTQGGCFYSPLALYTASDALDINWALRKHSRFQIPPKSLKYIFTKTLVWFVWKVSPNPCPLTFYDTRLSIKICRMFYLTGFVLHWYSLPAAHRHGLRTAHVLLHHHFLGPFTFIFPIPPKPPHLIAITTQTSQFQNHFKTSSKTQFLLSSFLYRGWSLLN